MLFIHILVHSTLENRMTLCNEIQTLYERHQSEIDIKKVLLQFSDKNLGLKKCMCSKIINTTDINFTCSTCSDDPSVMYCAECFYAVGHKGHNWECKVDSFGQCDCGNTISLRKEASCKDHQSQHQQLFAIFSLDDITQLLLAGYQILLNNRDQNVIPSEIRESQVMIRILSILSLLADDYLPMNKFIDIIITDQYYKYFYTKPEYKYEGIQSFFEVFILDHYNQKDKKEYLFSKILNGDIFFRHYSLRFLSKYTDKLVYNQNECVLEFLIQCIIEPLGLYLANEWSFLDNINIETFNCLKSLAEKTQNFEQKIPNIQYLENLQDFLFCKSLTTVHSILYSKYQNKDQNFMIITQEKFLFLNQICEKNIYTLEIQQSDNFLLQMQLYFYLIQHDCLYCCQYIDYINLRYIPYNNYHLLQLLQQANINILDIDKNVFIDKSNLQNHEYECEFHKRNIKQLFKNLLQHQKYRNLLLQIQRNEYTEENTSILQIVPLYIPQLYLCRFIDIYKYDNYLEQLIQELNDELQLEQQMSFGDFIKLATYEIIQYRKVYLQIKLQELRTIKYYYDLDVIVKTSNEQFQHLICDYYFVISNLLSKIPIDDQFQFIRDIFNVAQKSLIEFLGELLYIPIPTNTTDKLKYFIANIYKDYHFTKLRYTELVSYFSVEQISKCFSELYQTQVSQPLIQGSLNLKETQYIEITMLQNSNDFLLNNKLPKRVLSNDCCNEIMIPLLSNKSFIKFIEDQIFDLDNNSDAMNVQLVRILKQANYNFKQLTVFDKLEANKHLKELIQIQQPKSVEFSEKVITNVANKLSIKDRLGQKLKQRSLSASQVSSLLQFDSRQNYNIDNDFEETCPICHQTFQKGAIYAVPAKTMHFYNHDNRLNTNASEIIIFRTCMHSYHRHCINTDKCMICQFGKDTTLLFISDINNEIYDLDYQLTEEEQNQVNQIKYPRSSVSQYLTLKTLNQMLQYYENLFYIDGIDLYSDLFIQDMKSLINVYKCFVQIGRSEQQKGMFSKYTNFIKGRILYSIIKDYLINNDQQIKPLIQKCKAATDATNNKRIQLFSQGILSSQSSYEILRRLRFTDNTCMCGEIISPGNAQQNFGICIKCGQVQHLKCAVLEQGHLICNKCKSHYGMYLPLDGSIVQSSSRIYPQPYRTRFAEQQSSLFGQEMFLNSLDRDYLITLIALQQMHKIHNIQLMRYVQILIGYTKVQQKEMLQLINEDKINEEDLQLLLYDDDEQ